MATIWFRIHYNSVSYMKIQRSKYGKFCILPGFQTGGKIKEHQILRVCENRVKRKLFGSNI
jgi:hypothetical protein